MATNSVNFFQPGTEQAIDMRQVQRQRELADLLRQQGQTAQQGQMVSGHYVAPGKGAYVAQLANALFGNLASRRADDQEREMGQRLKAGREKESNDFLAALSGTPGQAARDIAPLTPNDDEGNAMPVARTDAIPGVPADQNKALGIGMRSDNPTLQALAAKLMEQKMQDSAFEGAFGLGGGGGAPAGVPAAGGAPAGPGGMPGAPDGGMPPQAASMPAGSGQFLGNNPGQVPVGLARLAFRKDPAEVAKMVMKAREPANVTEGGTLFNQATNQPIFTAPKTEAGIGVSGGVAAPIPGFAEAQARREALQAQARQGAESQNTMVTINTPDGPRMVTRAQAVQLAGGAPSAGPAPAGGTLGDRNNNPGNLRPPGASTGFQKFDTPEAGLAALDQNLQAYGKKGINTIDGVINRWAPSSENNTSAYVAAVAKRLGVDPKQQIDLSSPYVRQALSTAIMLHENGASILTRGGAPTGGNAAGGPGIALQSDAAKEYDTARAKDFAKTAADLQDRGRGAGGTMRNLDTLEQLYKDPNVAKGGLAENISGLKNIGASLGVETKGLGTEQAIEAITNKMALDARSTAEGGGMPGAMSDADRNFLKAQQPGLSKTPEGRAAIIGNARKVAQRQVQIAQMANEYERANGRLDAGFDRAVADFAAQNPLFADQKAPASAAPAAAPDFKTLAAKELARRRAQNGG
jgi:hypothetical protein